MLVYRLQVTMRLNDERDSFSIDTIEVEAADATGTIAISREWQPGTSLLVPDVLMLVSPEGAVIWSLRRMGPTLASGDA